MNRKKTGFFSAGLSSILLVFVLLCLITFAVLSLSSAKSDQQFSQKLADRTTQYYAAEAKIYQSLAEMDAILLKQYQADPENWLEKAEAALEAAGYEVTEAAANATPENTEAQITTEAKGSAEAGTETEGSAGADTEAKGSAEAGTETEGSAGADTEAEGAAGAGTETEGAAGADTEAEDTAQETADGTEAAQNTAVQVTLHETVQEGQDLIVICQITDPETEDDGFYRILSWKTQNTEDWEADQTLPVLRREDSE